MTVLRALLPTFRWLCSWHQRRGTRSPIPASPKAALPGRQLTRPPWAALPAFGPCSRGFRVAHAAAAGSVPASVRERGWGREAERPRGQQALGKAPSRLTRPPALLGHTRELATARTRRRSPASRHVTIPHRASPRLWANRRWASGNERSLSAPALWRSRSGRSSF